MHAPPTPCGYAYRRGSVSPTSPEDLSALERKLSCGRALGWYKLSRNDGSEGIGRPPELDRSWSRGVLIPKEAVGSSL